MAQVVVSKRGQVTIPRAIRERLNLRAGEVLSVRETPDGLLVERWDPDHPVTDWEYHARFSPPSPRGRVYPDLNALESAFVAHDARVAAAAAAAATGR